MLKKTILLTALVGALTVATGASAATLSVLNDEGKWNSQVSNWETEDFEDATLAQGVNGITSNTGIGYIGNSSDRWWNNVPLDKTGGIDLDPSNDNEGQWRDVLTKGNNSNTLISFSAKVNSFGAFVDLLPAAKGTSILMSFQSEGTTVFEVEVTYFESGKGFWGIVSDTTFDAILMTHGSQQALKETYAMNYMKYGVNDVNLVTTTVPTESVTGVPLPGALWMFVSALVGMTFVRRTPRAKRARA